MFTFLATVVVCLSAGMGAGALGTLYILWKRGILSWDDRS